MWIFTAKHAGLYVLTCVDYIDIVYALLLDVYYNKTPSSKVMLNTMPLCERNVIVADSR